MTAPGSYGADRPQGAVGAPRTKPFRYRLGAIPSGSTTLRVVLIAMAGIASIAMSGCGSSSAPAVSSQASGSTRTTTSSPASHTASGGVADTPANPDRSYICAAEARDSGGQAIGYLTVAGSDNAAGQSECSAVAQSSGWTAVSSSPFHENLYTPVCFITFDAGQLTARIYTSDTASFSDGIGLCNPLLRHFGLATLPPV